MLDLKNLWTNTLLEVELHVSKANFSTWFKNTDIVKEEGGIIFVGVPNEFVKDWIFNKYHKFILQKMRDTSEFVRGVEYVVVKNIGEKPKAVIADFSKSPLLDADLVVSDKLVNQLRSGQLNEIQDYTQLRVRVESFTQVNQVADKIRDLGWQVVTLDEILKKLLKYFRLFELALGIFGFVTLAVAALGIINTMVMAIYERTREIGVMRAVGAARKHILKLFLWEASLIGLIGGLIGMLVSWLFTSLLEYGLNKWLISQGLVKTNLDIFSLAWWLFAFGIIFAIAVGFLAGLYPAIRASRLDPIRALRGE